MLEEAFRKLGEKTANLLTKTIDYSIEKVHYTFVKDSEKRNSILHQIQDEIFVKSIKPEMFKTEWFKEEIKKSKERAKVHSTSVLDWIDAMYAPYIGKAVPDVIFETLGIDRKKFPPLIKKVVELMDFVSDMGLLIGYCEVIGTFFSFTLLRYIGQFFDRLIDYSGLRTLTGYGFGTAFGTAIAPILTYSINEQLLPQKPDMRTIFDAFGRFKVTPTAFLEHLKIHGINPDEKLSLPEKETKLGYGIWYDNESIIKNFMNPEAWKEVPIETYGDLYMRLAESPVNYFILRAVAESGFYHREIFKRALLDSSYSPLAMALILLSCVFNLLPSFLRQI